MGSLVFNCPQDTISAIFEKRVTDRRTHGRTDRRTDKASYIDAFLTDASKNGKEKKEREKIKREKKSN